MIKRVVIEEFQISCFVSRKLPVAKAVVVRRVLNSKVFLAALHKALHSAVKRHGISPAVTVCVTK